MYLNYKLCSLNGGLAFMSGSIRRSVFVRVHGVYLEDRPGYSYLYLDISS